MNDSPFCLSVLVNGHLFATTLVNTGCLSYELCDIKFVKRHNLECLKIAPHTVTGVDEKVTAVTDEIVAVDLDLKGHQKQKAFFYVASLSYYNMILSMQ